MVGKVGSSIAAEIGTMRITEQIDALTTLDINPFKYLIVPRILASVIVFPILTVCADLIGIFGGIKEAKRLAIEKLNDVGLEENIAEMFPVELSGGMKKRVALARAIAHNPEIIVLDEPTSGLDPIMSDVVNEIIIKLSQDLRPTIITITHDIHSAFKIADKIAVLYEGEIISHGTVQEIQNTNNEYIKKFIYCI
ncbi:jg24763 [Pararge aegeria aegeria]|uniref:Jg24763 protein n=1 Tax=Pararge aegeria aegeria TaxID=348720 RepID=A0A8S4QGC5_9NEOP|nr:jg24763 [Pararge aegeria aegeria]